MLLYVPFGVLGVLSRLRANGAPQSRQDAFTVSVIAVLFSTANEALQLYTIDRVASVTDIVSAAVGALAGGVAVSLARRPR